MKFNEDKKFDFFILQPFANKCDKYNYSIVFIWILLLTNEFTCN